MALDAEIKTQLSQYLALIESDIVFRLILEQMKILKSQRFH